MPESSLVIDQFVEHYSREVDYFSELSRIAQRRIESSLRKHGIQAIVTSRAKGLDRLRDKLRARNLRKSYQDVSDIYEDIIDLAGVRVALYFPSDRDKLDSLLREVFEFSREPKSFPESSIRQPGRRFMGYFATHYLVRFKVESLDSEQARFSGRIEIQVASVLMHAWAEVEHDLQYKPGSGTPSEDESSILDELNGLVLSGEIALERLQRAVQRRTETSTVFNNQYELASVLAALADRLGFLESNIGKVETLFNALSSLKRNSASGLNPFTEAFSQDEKNSPIANVIMDRLLSAETLSDAEKHTVASVITKLVSSEESSLSRSNENAVAVEQFLNAWKDAERILRKEIAREGDIYRSFGFVLKEAKLKPMLMAIIQEARFVRNQLVHGVEPPLASRLIELTGQLTESLIPVLKEEAKSRVQPQ